MDDAYGDVVRRCLTQLFDVRVLNMDLEEVQKKVYIDIVAPLVENQKYLKSMPQMVCGSDLLVKNFWFLGHPRYVLRAYSVRLADPDLCKAYIS